MRKRFRTLVLVSVAAAASAGLTVPTAADARPCADCTGGGEEGGGGGGGGGGTANTAPSASFTVAPSAPTTGQLVTYTSTSTDVQNNISKYEWDLDGDGFYESSGSQSSATKTYLTPGTYSIGLRVTDGGGLSSDARTNVTVSSTSGGGGTGGGGTGGGDTGGESTPPPEPSAAPGCDSRTEFGGLEVVGECLRREGDNWVTTRPLRVNGLDMVPQTGQITINPATSTFSGKVRLGLGTLKLYEGPINWDMSKPLEFDSAKNAVLKELAVVGGIRFTPGENKTSQLRVNVKVSALSDEFGGATGETTLVADNARGLRLGDLDVRVKQALLGPVEIQDVILSYEGELDRWYGRATVFLPTPEPRVRIDADASFVGGAFHSANASVDNLNAPLGPGVTLQRISFSIEMKPNLKLEGGIGVSAGPQLPDGKRPVRIDGKLKMVFGDPVVIRADGVLYVRGLQLANAYAEYRSSGYFGVGARTSLWIDRAEKIGVEGRLDGWVDGERAFNIEGAAVIRIYDWKLQGEALVSSVGMSACGHASAGWFGKIDLGFGYRWSNQDLQIMGASCDVGRYRAVTRAARVGEPRTADIPGGLQVATFAVEGAGGPPVVKVTGPKGETAVSPSEPGQRTEGKFLFFRNPDDSTTYVALAKPSAGTWKVEAEDGSAPIASMQQANGLPEPDVDAKVTGRGTNRTLSYSVRPIPGQTVRFVEQGHDSTRVIGVARARRGKLRFKPAEGSAGRRLITAVIEQDGVVREQVNAGSYSAPKPVKPGKATRLAVKRSGSNLRVSWKKAPGSARYAVHVVLADGRSKTIVAKGTAATVPAVGTEAATVAVAGMSKTGAFGPKAKARIARGARVSR